MVTIEELKLGNRTLEALKFLLSQITELETAISQINISEIKDANTLTKEQIATLQDVKNAVETISSDLSLKKSEFDEKKQNFDTNMNAFRNDKADFDEKKADFDSKNSTALSNFAFIASNVEKINSTSALLAEAKTVLETIKPIEQRTQAALDTIANSQAKFAELDALKATLLELKRSLENISMTGLINDNSASTTTTYSSTKINNLLVEKLDASEKNKYVSLENGKIKAEILPDIDATTLNGKKANVFELKSDSQIKFNTLNQSVERVKGSLNQGLNSLTDSLGTKISSNLKGVANGVATLDNLGKIPIEQLPKIDAYTKKESDEKFALKDDLPPLATEAKAGIVKLENTTNGNAEDATVTQKAINEKLTEMRGKVKIVDFGTVTINKRYVINNPFGNDKWASCVTIPQLQHNGKWFQAGWFYTGSGYYSTGVVSGSMSEGIVVQTGGNLISDGSVYEGNLYGGTGIEPRLASAKCRVLVFYIGELQ